MVMYADGDSQSDYVFDDATGYTFYLPSYVLHLYFIQTSTPFVC